MLEDKAGNVWFGTDAGVSRYNAGVNSGAMLGFTKKDGFTDEHVSSIIEDKTGKLWFGAHDGIYLFDGKSFSVLQTKKVCCLKIFVRCWKIKMTTSGSRRGAVSGDTILQQQVIHHLRN
jgi:hypothetical protein